MRFFLSKVSVVANHLQVTGDGVCYLRVYDPASKQTFRVLGVVALYRNGWFLNLDPSRTPELLKPLLVSEDETDLAPEPSAPTELSKMLDDLEPFK